MKVLHRSFLLLNWNQYFLFKSSSILSCYKAIHSQYRLKKSKAFNFYSKQKYIKESGRQYFPHYKVYTLERVGSFVKNLDDLEKQALFTELQKYKLKTDNNNDSHQSSGSSTTVSTSQLKWLFVYNCAPFIGFGFLDNAIMILAGEYIDLTIGCMLGISTMAAAALGNLVSDLAGLGLASYVEVLCGKMGLPIPDLSSQQLELSSSRFSANSGKAFGIALGCLLGMFPLLLLKERKEQDEANDAL